MNNRVETHTKSNIELNNAKTVLDSLQSKENFSQELFLTMVQGNTYSDVDITDSNIKNNSHFIVNLWD